MFIIFLTNLIFIRHNGDSAQMLAVCFVVVVIHFLDGWLGLPALIPGNKPEVISFQEGSDKNCL